MLYGIVALRGWKMLFPLESTLLKGRLVFTVKEMNQVLPVEPSSEQDQ